MHTSGLHDHAKRLTQNVNAIAALLACSSNPDVGAALYDIATASAGSETRARLANFEHRGGYRGATTDALSLVRKLLASVEQDYAEITKALAPARAGSDGNEAA